jgi:hypothetical protein
MSFVPFLDNYKKLSAHSKFRALNAKDFRLLVFSLSTANALDSSGYSSRMIPYPALMSACPDNSLRSFLRFLTRYVFDVIGRMMTRIYHVRSRTLFFLRHVMSDMSSIHRYEPLFLLILRNSEIKKTDRHRSIMLLSVLVRGPFTIHERPFICKTCVCDSFDPEL